MKLTSSINFFRSAADMPRSVSLTSPGMMRHFNREVGFSSLSLLKTCYRLSIEENS